MRMIVMLCVVAASILSLGQMPEKVSRQMFVTITDKKGHPPKNVQGDALRVTYGGKPVNVDAHLSQRPMDFVVVIDVSGSNRYKVKYVQQYAEEIFRAASAGGGRGWLVAFNTSIVRAVGPVDEKQFAAELQSLQFKGETALFGAVKTACEKGFVPTPAGGRRAMFLMSDGSNNSGATNIDQAIGACLEAHVPIFVVGTLGPVNPRPVIEGLRNFGEQTGGAAKLLDQPGDVSRWLAEVMQSQYELTFTAAPSSDLQAVKVEPVDRQLRVSSPKKF